MNDFVVFFVITGFILFMGGGTALQIIKEHRVWNGGISPYDGSKWEENTGHTGSEAGIIKRFYDSSGNVFETTWVTWNRIEKDMKKVS